MGFVFIICLINMHVISMSENADGKRVNGLELDTKMVRMSKSFAAGAMIIVGILTALYTIFWQRCKQATFPFLIP